MYGFLTWASGLTGLALMGLVMSCFDQDMYLKWGAAARRPRDFTGRGARPITMIVLCGVVCLTTAELGLTWHVNAVTNNLHTGSVLELRAVELDTRARISEARVGGISADFVVARVSDRAGCSDRFVQGSSMRIVNSLEPLRLTLVGQAASPDYRYLFDIKEDSGCVLEVFVTKTELVNMVGQFKSINRVINKKSDISDINRELASVHPV